MSTLTEKITEALRDAQHHAASVDGTAHALTATVAEWLESVDVAASLAVSAFLTEEFRGAHTRNLRGEIMAAALAAEAVKGAGQ